MGIDEYETLPRLSAYLRSLPAGFDSYPDTLVKASTVAQIDKMLPDDFPWERITGRLGDLLKNPPPVSSWIPEINACALLMAVRDAGFDSDEAFLAWMRACFEGFWNGSLYRVLMAVASPARLARGGAKRWAAIRRGSSREITQMFSNGNLARVDYPEHLVNELYAQTTCVGIEVAYRLSRAADPIVRIEEFTPTYYVTRVLYDQRKPIDA